MAKIVMKDGSSKVVNYKVAAHIYQIKLGNEEPKDQKQADFCTLVDQVIFDAPELGNSRQHGSGNMGERFLNYIRREVDSEQSPD